MVYAQTHKEKPHEVAAMFPNDNALNPGGNACRAPRPLLFRR